MSVVIQLADGGIKQRYPRGMFIRRGLENGEIAISVSPSGEGEDPQEFELSRGVPRFFVNEWGVRVGRVGDVAFWEEVEDFPEIGDPNFATIKVNSTVTVWVTLP